MMVAKTADHEVQHNEQMFHLRESVMRHGMLPNGDCEREGLR